MRRRSAILLALSAMPSSAFPATITDEAIASLTAPETQFRSFLAGLLFKTQTMSMAAYLLGAEGNCKLVVPAFEAAVAKHLPDWRRNLIAAYRSEVPEAALADAVAAGAAAGSQNLGSYQEAIGAAMQRTSEPILKQAAGEVLAPIFSAATQIDTKSIDHASRTAEMQAANANNSVRCGLLQPQRRPS